MTVTLPRSLTILGTAIVLVGASGCGGSPQGSTTPSSGSAAVGTTTSPTATSTSSGGEPDRSSSTTSSAPSSASAGAGASESGASSAGHDGTSTAPGRGTGAGEGAAYDVVSVVDGDTIKVRMDGHKETIRIIGLDTPETKKPRVPVQCYGKEASSHMQSLVQSKQVQVSADSSQGERDKYGRLLRHVFVGGSTNVALAQIEGGFGREYTYDGPYEHRLEYLAAQNQAKNAHRGTWGPPCNGFHTQSASTTSVAPSAGSSSGSAAPSVAVPPAPSPDAAAGGGAGGACTIKGNINSKGEKIAHAPGSATYDKTKITASKGERMFCSAAEATAAGWRMAND